MLGLHLEGKLQSCIGLGETDHGLQLPHRHSVGVIVVFVLVADLNIEGSQQFGTLLSQLGFELPRQGDVQLECLHVVHGVYYCFLVAVHVYDELTEVLICLGVGLVADHEEQIETRHDRGTEVNIVL